MGYSEKQNTLNKNWINPSILSKITRKSPKYTMTETLQKFELLLYTPFKEIRFSS